MSSGRTQELEIVKYRGSGSRKSSKMDECFRSAASRQLQGMSSCKDVPKYLRMVFKSWSERMFNHGAALRTERLSFPFGSDVDDAVP